MERVPHSPGAPGTASSGPYGADPGQPVWIWTAASPPQGVPRVTCASCGTAPARDDHRLTLSVMRRPLLVLGVMATVWVALLWMLSMDVPETSLDEGVRAKMRVVSPVGWVVVHLGVVAALSFLVGAVAARVPGLQPTVTVRVCSACSRALSARGALGVLAAWLAPLSVALLFLDHPLDPALPPVPLAALAVVALGGALVGELLNPTLLGGWENQGRAWLRVAAGSAPQLAVDAPHRGPGWRMHRGSLAAVAAALGTGWALVTVPFPDGCLAGARRVSGHDGRHSTTFHCELPDGSDHGLSEQVYGHPDRITHRKDRYGRGLWQRVVDRNGRLWGFTEFDGDHERHVGLDERGNVITERNETGRVPDGLQRVADDQGRPMLRALMKMGLHHGPFEAWCRNAQAHWRCVEGTFEEGLGQGRWRWFHPNGAVAMDATYARGHKVGPWAFVDENGQEVCRGAYREGELPPRTDPFVLCLWKEHVRFRPWLTQVGTTEEFHMAGVGRDFGPGSGPAHFQRP